MGPAIACSDREAKASNRPLTNSDSLALWKWQVIMGTKAKGLYHLLEDTEDDVERAIRHETNHQRDLLKRDEERRQAEDALSNLKQSLDDLPAETEDLASTAAHAAARAAVTDAKSRLRSSMKSIDNLYHKADKLRQQQDSLMFQMSKVLDIASCIKVQSAKTPAEMWHKLVNFYEGCEIEDQFTLEESLHDITFIEHK